MDWITGIERAIRFVEAHITEPIDYEEVAKQAYSSGFHFQRVFGLLVGYTLGDYVRMRRLSMAGRELASANVRVIDVAHKYGYDSPESFSRAFTRFHGVSPAVVKRGGAKLKSFSPLFAKLILDGGNIIRYRIETQGAFQLICKRMRAPLKSEMTTEQMISGFWRECIADDTAATLCGYISENDIFKNCLVGASFGRDATDADFPYGIGVHYNGAKIMDTSLVVAEIPAHTYVVFTCAGEMPAAFVQLCKQIGSEFFPTSDYQPCGGTDFEAYPSADVTNPDYTCELWVAVTKNLNR